MDPVNSRAVRARLAHRCKLAAGFEPAVCRLRADCFARFSYASSAPAWIRTRVLASSVRRLPTGPRAHARPRTRTGLSSLARTRRTPGPGAQWTRQDSNLGPPACQAGALPLSYEPMGPRGFEPRSRRFVRAVARQAGRRPLMEPARFERTASCLRGRCSTMLSYGPSANAGTRSSRRCGATNGRRGRLPAQGGWAGGRW